MMALVCSPRAWEVETEDRSAGLHSEFKASQGLVRLGLKNREGFRRHHITNITMIHCIDVKNEVQRGETTSLQSR